MKDKELNLLKEIERYISEESKKNLYTKRGQLRSGIEQRILEKYKFFSQMNMELLEKLLEQKMNLRWEIISKFDFLTEDFIKRNIHSLSPTVILKNYPDLSKETKDLLYSRLGVLKRLKYGVIEDEEVINNYHKYGKNLKNRIKQFVENYPEKVSESLALFVRLIN
jgi:hypothetical protein